MFNTCIQNLKKKQFYVNPTWNYW